MITDKKPIRTIYNYEEWIVYCDKNKLWRSTDTPFLAYKNGLLVTEWDKYRGYGYVYQ